MSVDPERLTRRQHRIEPHLGTLPNAETLPSADPGQTAT